MSLNDIALARGLQSNLLILRSTDRLHVRTAERLTSGRRINSPVDGAQSYFLSKNQQLRAQDLAGRKDGMGTALSTIDAASSGIDAMLALTAEMRSLLASARAATDPAERANLSAQFDALAAHVRGVADDSAFNGVNLLGGDTLLVELNERGTAQYAVNGLDVTNDLAWAAAPNAWAANGDIDSSEAMLDGVEAEIRSFTGTFAHAGGLIGSRAAFTEHMIATLQTGAAHIVAADPNEEGANMLALQTRRQVAMQAVSIIADGQRAILSFFQ